MIASYLELCFVGLPLVLSIVDALAVGRRILQLSAGLALRGRGLSAFRRRHFDRLIEYEKGTFLVCRFEISKLGILIILGCTPCSWLTWLGLTA